MLVQPIVALHGGTLDSTSMIGQGSCLKISLPHTDTRSDSASVIGDNTDDIDTIVEEISEPPLISIVEDNELLVVNMDNIVSEDLWS